VLASPPLRLVLADGWIRGGASGARGALDAYWERVASMAAFSPLQRTLIDRLLGRWTLDTSPAFIALDLMSRVFSPYDLIPVHAARRGAKVGHGLP
jgi:NTE family protein